MCLQKKHKGENNWYDMVNILLLLTLVVDLGKQDELEDKKAYFIVLNEICPPQAHI